MEEDRAMADLGPDVNPTAELNADAEPVPKAPKRRFIGRKAADAIAAAKAEASNGTIEDSGAVQGDVCLLHTTLAATDVNSGASTTGSSCVEQCSGRHTARQGYQRSHCVITEELQLRDPQDDSPDTIVWGEEDCPPNARGSAVVCHHHLRHIITVLPWRQYTHHG